MKKSLSLLMLLASGAYGQSRKISSFTAPTGTLDNVRTGTLTDKAGTGAPTATNGVKIGASGSTISTYVDDGTCGPLSVKYGSTTPFLQSFNQWCHYSKIGKLVTISGRVDWSLNTAGLSQGLAGAIYVTNLPFTSKNNMGSYGTCTLTHQNINPPTNYAYNGFTLLIESNATSAILLATLPGRPVNSSGVGAQNGGDQAVKLIQFTCTYYSTT